MRVQQTEIKLLTKQCCPELALEVEHTHIHTNTDHEVMFFNNTKCLSH
jgi:hypothetical protein